MSEGGPIARVVSMLETAGYVVLQQPQEVAGVPFDFDALLVGRGTLDLIALLDLAIYADPRRVRRRIEALARALDVVDSRRPLTAILVGPRPPHELIRTIAEVARVLVVGTPAEGEDATLRDALAVLLPLDIATEPADLDEAADWSRRRDRLRADHPVELVPVLAVTSRGEKAVTEALRSVLVAPLEQDGEEVAGE